MMNTTDTPVTPATATGRAPARWPVFARLRGTAARGMCAAVAAGALAGVLAGATPAGASAAATSAPAGNWSQLSPAATPPAANDSIGYDSGSGQTILLTEVPSSGSGLAYTAQTWDWNGSTWTQLHPASSPSARFGASMTYDPALGGLVLFGGESFNGSSYVFDADTWLWNGTTWTQLKPAASPPARAEAAMAYDPATSQLILFGGEGGNPTLGANGLTYLNDTWAFNGTTWTHLAPAGSPSARYLAAFAYDPATSQLILFGGLGDNGTPTYGDTWNWTGTTWTSLSPASSPPARYAASFAYDAATSQLILFGGANTTVDGDTWNWTGTTWIQVSPATSPPPTTGGVMAYDASTGDLLLFGGSGGATSGGTWVYAAPSAPVITSGGTATFTQGSPGTFTVTASGNPAATFSESGALPAGLSFSSSGVLSGTPSGVAGPFDLIITATNSAGSATQDLLLVVNEAPVITSPHTAVFVVGAKGKFQVTAAGYPAPTFTETGTLPAGLSLSSAGLLSGTPAAEGSYPIVITATNAAGTGTQKFTLTIVA